MKCTKKLLIYEVGREYPLYRYCYLDSGHEDNHRFIVDETNIKWMELEVYDLSNTGS